MVSQAGVHYPVMSTVWGKLFKLSVVVVSRTPLHEIQYICPISDGLKHYIAWSAGYFTDLSHNRLVWAIMLHSVQDITDYWAHKANMLYSVQ
ncbi:hypothetical protein EV294_104353 [Paenibacillus sp. BK033]|nr:hypothetical protein EV294_104353 [Paenibacillus sp. BK033]